MTGWSDYWTLGFSNSLKGFQFPVGRKIYLTSFLIPFFPKELRPGYN